MRSSKSFNVASLQTGNANDNTEPPKELMGKLLYFKNIESTSKLSVLNGKLMLAHSGVTVFEDFVLGFILNVVGKEKFGQMMKREGQPVSEKISFLPVWRGDADNPLGVMDNNYTMSFLWPKKLTIPGQTDFADFAIYRTKSAEAAVNIAEWLTDRNKKQFMLLLGETLIDWQDLKTLLVSGKCHVANAPYDIVFDTSGEMRARRAFPHLFPNDQGPKPEPAKS